MLSNTDREAGGSLPFATSFRPPQHSLPASPSVDTARGLPDPQGLRADIAEALQANIARGFLESEERFRQIAEALNDVVTLTNQDRTQLFFVNAAFERIWGQSRETLYANPQACLEAVHPDDRARVRDVMVSPSRPDFDLEFRLVRPDGAQRWVWARGFPVLDANGEIYRVATIVEDITERKTITESHERLLRGFTHDVKNPLGVADGSLSLLEMGVSGELSPAQLEHVARARRSIRTALNLVFQLLEIQRAASGELQVDRSRVDVGNILRECAEDFRAAAHAKRQSLTLQISCEDEELVIESDRPRVRQILANLLSNAVKYTQEEGSILLSARVAGDEDDEAPRRGHWLALVVADTGPGIPPEKTKLLFHEFTRFSPTAADGSGIGLAISQHLARALSAVITVRSTRGVGSTFTLWLPRDRAPGITR